MSGLFAAWRLLVARPGLSVVVVDKLPRVGGRLETTMVDFTLPGGGSVTVKDEEGGMRFCPDGTGMPNLWGLINTFELPYDPFVMGSDVNRMYFRGTPFTVAQSPAIWQTLYRLAPQEQGQKPTAILASVMQAILDQNPGSHQVGQWPDSPADWITFRDTFQFNGIVINQWGFWSLLRTYGLTEEAIEMIGCSIGFMGPMEAFINAGESLQILFDFPGTEVFQTLRGGMGGLPMALATAVAYLGGTIGLDTQVTSLTGEDGLRTVATTQGIYTAQSVVLALPSEAVRSIMSASPALQSPSFVQAVHDVRPMELTKIGLFFETRWWAAATGMLNGPSFSDLPAGSVYCFSQFPNDPTADQAYTGPAALTIYTDFTRGNFWKEMNNIGAPYQVEGYPQPANTFPATVALVTEAMKQIALIFDQPYESLPTPVIATYRVWGQGDFGHGYHQYRVGVADGVITQNIWNPAAGVYVCNEAWSPEQGWIEGALMATDRVLVEGFQLSPFVPSPLRVVTSKPAPHAHHINDRSIQEAP
jgi:monoamine oxidase